MIDIIIVGGGIAGLTAAIYSLRAGKSVLILESDNFGGQITFSPRVENYPGFQNISGNELADRLVTQVLSLGAGVEIDKVMAVETDGDIKKVIAEHGEYACKSIIIATGAKHRHLGIEGEERFEGSGVSYCAICDGAFFKNQAVAVVGGGSAALQSALYLSSICKKVYLIHRRESFRGETYLADSLKKCENIEFVLNSTVCAFGGTDEIESITVKRKTDGAEQKIDVSGVFIAVGQVPNNKSFDRVAELDENGYIVAGEDCKTKTDGIFAAGDCRTKTVRQLTTAAADGAVAAVAACTYIDAL